MVIHHINGISSNGTNGGVSSTCSGDPGGRNIIEKVAVIGAGASGLTAIKEMLKKGFNVTAFEAKPQVGGAWIYSPDPPEECVVTFDGDGRPVAMTKGELEGAAKRDGGNPDVGANGSPTASGSELAHDILLDPSPMYKLRTNIPCNLMSYRGFPFAETSGPFPRDDEVLQYLKDYASDVLPYIRFNTLVKRICKPSKELHENGTARDTKAAQWRVETVQTKNAPDGPGKSRVEYFDAICDCSGHYTRPYIPYTPGLWKFKKRILHAKWYRTPDEFLDKNVLVVGNSASGYDVGREIATLFHEKRSKRRVYQSMRHGFEIGIDPSEGVLWSSHLTTLPGIARVTSDKTVEFLDGQKLDFDVIIYATGYLYSFPYYHKQDAPFNRFPLTKTPSLPVQTEGKQESHRRWPCTKQDSIVYPDGGLQVINLDKHYQTFYCPDPTLALICLNKQVIPFPLAQTQAHAVAKYWAGEANIDIQPEAEQGGEDATYHKYGAPKEFDVADALLRAVGEGQQMDVLREDQAEILPDGTFPATAIWRRKQRPECKPYRKRVLGY